MGYNARNLDKHSVVITADNIRFIAWKLIFILMLCFLTFETPV